MTKIYIVRHTKVVWLWFGQFFVDVGCTLLSAWLWSVLQNPGYRFYCMLAVLCKHMYSKFPHMHPPTHCLRFLAGIVGSSDLIFFSLDGFVAFTSETKRKFEKRMILYFKTPVRLEI